VIRQSSLSRSLTPEPATTSSPVLLGETAGKRKKVKESERNNHKKLIDL